MKILIVMKTIALIIMILTNVVAGMAQDGFKITAETSGVPDCKMYLIGDNADTLAVANMVNGRFELTGKVNAGMVAYIMTADGKANIPVMLENTNYSMVANAHMVNVTGGKAQDILNQYNSVSASIQQEQMRLQKEAQQAYQEGNQMKMQAMQQQFGKFIEKAEAQQMELLKMNANSFVAAYIVAQMMQRLDVNPLKELYAMLGEEAKASATARAIQGQIAAFERLEEGEVAPNFITQTVEGDTISLHGIKGKVKILDFWASWCVPCRQEVPNLVKLYKNYRGKGLEIFSVSIDQKPQDWVKAISEDGMTWKHGIDPNSQIISLYCLKSIPYMILLDENNRIVAKNLRGAQLQKKVAELLKK